MMIRVLSLLAHAFAVSGKRDEALKTLDKLQEISKRRYVSAYGVALLYAGLGEKDQAFSMAGKELSRSRARDNPD